MLIVHWINKICHLINWSQQKYVNYFAPTKVIFPPQLEFFVGGKSLLWGQSNSHISAQINILNDKFYWYNEQKALRRSVQCSIFAQFGIFYNLCKIFIFFKLISPHKSEFPPTQCGGKIIFVGVNQPLKM